MPSESTSLSRTLGDLSQACLNSQQAYAYAAQHTRNRGLKLLLKSYAHERAQFRVQLRELGGPASAEITTSASSGAFGRGLANVRAWFTVRRQTRQRLLLHKVVEAEQAAIAAYTNALAEQPEQPLSAAPSAAEATLRSQLNAFQQAEKLLNALAARRSGDAMLVRLYERPDQVQQVVDALTGTGVAQDDIYVADVQQLTPDAADAPERERSRWETMAVAALLGAIIGALIVLPFAVAQRIYFPQVNGIFATGSMGVLLEYVVGGMLVGAIFGLYFSIFIGQDIVEDDAYFTAQSLDKGTLLVAVPATAANRAEVERVLGLQHQFEVQPKPA
jgi:hypothetical protein